MKRIIINAAQAALWIYRCFVTRGKVAGIALAIMVSACEIDGIDPVDDNDEGEPPIALNPVETRPGNGAGYQPAFAGQTRISGVKTTTPIETTLLVADAKLYKPWSFKFISSSQIILAQKDGTMRIIGFKPNGLSIGEPLAGVPPVFFDQRELDGTSNSANAGLFDIALDPDFATNHLIYFSYSKGIGPSNRLTISKANLVIDGNKLVNVKEIYEVSHAHAGAEVYGGRLVFDREGYLMVTTGERHRNDSRYMSQNLNSSIGKILRLDRNGNPAPGNPFAGIQNALSEIWALGIRSPLGLAFHPTTGVLWETEHGPKGGDELNIIEKGKNYGWPIISYGIMYDGTPVGQGIFPVSGSDPREYRFEIENLIGGGITAQAGMEQPRYYWDPAIAPGGITFYTSTAIPEWKNNLFIAGLASKHLIRLIIRDDKVVGEERFMDQLGFRLRDVQQGPDGALYVVTDTPEGRIYRIGKAL